MQTLLRRILSCHAMQAASWAKGCGSSLGLHSRCVSTAPALVAVGGDRQCSVGGGLPAAWHPACHQRPGLAGRFLILCSRSVWRAGGPCILSCEQTGQIREGDQAGVKMGSFFRTNMQA